MSGATARRRRGFVALAVAVLVATSFAVAPAGAAPGNGNGGDHQQIPDSVLERVTAVQRKFGGLSIRPTSGPVGTVITYSGSCGFPADTVSVSLARETSPGVFNAVAVNLFVAIPSTSNGAFSVTLTVPANGIPDVTPGPVTPGPYGALAACDFLTPDEKQLNTVTFTVTET